MKPIANIVSVDPEQPDPTIIRQAAAAIRSGGLVVFPTYGLYGLGADPFNPQAVQRVFQIKGRAADKPILVLISQISDLNRVAIVPHAMARHLMYTFWPGKVTFILPARTDLPPALVGQNRKIGVRLVAHPVSAALINALAGPLTGTSANISGAGGCATVQQIDRQLRSGVDLVLDSGPLAGGLGSTIVDVTGTDPIILREGAVPAAALMYAFKGHGKNVL